MLIPATTYLDVPKKTDSNSSNTMFSIIFSLSSLLIRVLLGSLCFVLLLPIIHVLLTDEVMCLRTHYCFIPLIMIYICIKFFNFSHSLAIKSKIHRKLRYRSFCLRFHIKSYTVLSVRNLYYSPKSLSSAFSLDTPFLTNSKKKRKFAAIYLSAMEFLDSKLLINNLKTLDSSFRYLILFRVYFGPLPYYKMLGHQVGLHPSKYSLQDIHDLILLTLKCFRIFFLLW